MKNSILVVVVVEGKPLILRHSDLIEDKEKKHHSEFDNFLTTYGVAKINMLLYPQSLEQGRLAELVLLELCSSYPTSHPPNHQTTKTTKIPKHDMQDQTTTTSSPTL